MSENDWIELSLNIPDPDEGTREIAVAILADMGFESFSNTEEGIKAYISSIAFTPEMTDEKSLGSIPALQGCTINYRTIEKINWNLEWEKNFNPVIIADRCSVRAPFHPKPENVEFDIVIEPKMSFGTGHHQTTALMAELLLDKDVKDMKVLDMGCGTGILAILASLKGASKIKAVDIDEWACVNTEENAAANHVVIEVVKGDIDSVKGVKFDLVLANITRNILIENMNTLGSYLNPDGFLFLSGFYEKDLQDISNATASAGLLFLNKKTMDDWCAAAFKKM